jgi:EmrB/QacA subfamily drug resistance transporter
MSRLVRVPPTPPNRWAALAVIAVAQLLIILDVTIVNIALPTAQAALDISDANRQWVVTAYTLPFGGLLLLGGRIADFTGRKRAFIVGLVGFGAASALGGAATSAGMLFAARGLQGAFGALMAPAALSLLTVTFTEPRERARAFGVYGAVAGGGGAVGLLLGGVLTEYASWRWTLLVSTPIAVGAALCALRYVTESRATGNTRYDLPGALTSTAGLLALVYGFTEASTDGWTAPLTLALLAAAAGLLVAFVVIETRSTHPLLPLRIVLDKNRGAAYLARLLVGVAIFGVFLFLTYYLQHTLHYSALETGVSFLPFTAGIVAGAAVSTRLLPKVGPRVAMTAGLALATAGMLLLVRVGVDTGYWTHVIPAEVVMSLGMGATFGPLASTALIGVAEHDAGVASALVNTAQQVGGSLGTAMLNTVATSVAAAYLVEQGPAAAVARGYSVVFGVSAALLGVATIATWLLVRPERRSPDVPRLMYEPVLLKADRIAVIHQAGAFLSEDEARRVLDIWRAEGRREPMGINITAVYANADEWLGVR